METKWKAAFGIAAANDILDLTPIGSSPIPGIFLDIGTNIALWPVLKTRRSLLTSIEYIPGADPIPAYTATVTYAYMRRKDENSKRNIPIS